MRFGIAALTCAASPVFAQSIWNGQGGDDSWSTPGNWQGGVAPVSDPSTIIQMAGTTRLTPNITGSFHLASLTFLSGAGAFNLSGGELVFTQGATPDSNLLVNSSLNSQTVSSDIKITRGQIHAGNGGLRFTGNIDVDQSSGIRFYSNLLGTMVFDSTSVISGTIASNRIIYNGPGTYQLKGYNSYVGATSIWYGKVLVEVDALETGGAFGKDTSAVGLGVNGGTAQLLTNAAVEIGRSIIVVSGATATLGGASADTSVYSKNIILGTDNSTSQSVTVTAAENGRVNITGNIVRASNVSGSNDHVTKTGKGILALYGSGNNYAGATNVNEGTLLVNGQLADGGQGVTVNAGAALGGDGDGISTGVIARNTTIKGGATFAPGDIDDNGFSLAGHLTFTKSLTFEDGAVLEFNIGSAFDTVTVHGLLTLDGTLNITAGDGFGPGNYKLFEYLGSYVDNGITLGSLPFPDLYDYTLDFSEAGAVYLQVIPEPNSVLLLGAGVMAGFAVRRRKQA